MQAIIENLKNKLTESIMDEFKNTLDRLRTKIFKALDVSEDDQPEIDLEKFAQNTLNKIMTDDVFMTTEEELKKIIKSPKLKKDPDAPKASVNSFILFCRDNRDDVKKENPTLKSSEITKKLGEMWKSSDPDLIEEYKEKSKEDKERYERELEDYLPKEGFQNPKEKKSSKSSKSKKDPNAPKRPLNAYMYFSQDKRDELKKKNFAAKEILSELGRMWKNLSEKKRLPYEQKAKKDKERFQEEMKNYSPPEGESKSKKSGPKKPLTAFMIYRKDVYQKVKEENEGMKITDISKIIGDMWKNLSENEKKKYTTKASKLKEDFKSEESSNDDNNDNNDENHEKKELKTSKKETKESKNESKEPKESKKESKNESKEPKEPKESKKESKNESKEPKESKNESKESKKETKEPPKESNESKKKKFVELPDFSSSGTPRKCMPNLFAESVESSDEKETKTKKKNDKGKKKYIDSDDEDIMD
jgi:hypothetical protein